MHAEMGRGVARRRRARSTPCAARAGASSPSAPRRCGCSRRAGDATASIAPFAGDDRHLHHARLPLPRRRRAADQLPPAALDAVHAGRGLLRPRAMQRGLCACDRARLPLLFLRRRLPALSRPHTRATMTDALRASTLLDARDGGARRGEIATPHGIDPHAGVHAGRHAATVKALYPDQVSAAGADIVLGNTYHLMLRPGAERVASSAACTVHALGRPILTDSGGFQVMSPVASCARSTEEGVRVPVAHRRQPALLTPERAIEIQCLLGADILMELDECIALPAEREEAERAMELSLRWAERGKRAFADARRAGPGAVRHRAGRHRCRPAPRARPRRWSAMDFPGLRHRRPGGRRGQAADADDARRRLLPTPARGQAALPDGRRHAGRPHRSGGARHRHVRLRAADAQRPPRPRLHLGRQGQPAQRPPRRGSAPARSREQRARPRATIRAPTCTTSSSRANISAPCCCPGSTPPSTRS